MKLAFSSNAFRKHSIEETIGILRDIGYEGVELMADAPHAWPPDVTEEKIASIRDALAKHDMQVSNVNAFMMCTYKHPKTGKQGTFHWPSWLDEDRETREARITHTIRSVEIGAAIGAKTISTEPGGPLDGLSREDGYRRYAEGLKRAADRAAELGVTVLVEPEPGLIIEKADQYLEFMKHVDFEGVGLNFDMGHFYCVGEDPSALIGRSDLQPMHYHLEDIAADRVHHHLPPGDGAMDFKAIFAALRARNYDGWVTIELYPFIEDAPAVARAAYEFIHPYMK